MASVHEYGRRLENARERIRSLPNSGFILSFIDHLMALGLSAGRVAKYANHIYTLIRRCPFDPQNATRRDIENVIAWINSQPYKSSTKEDLKIVVRKIIQYAKYGSCSRKTPIPSEVSWFSINRSEKDSRVKPDSLLSPEDVKAMINAAENERDKALISVLFEGALRPGEILTMNVGSVTFRKDYCLITVNGKTGVRRIPLVASYEPLLEWLNKHPKGDDPNAPLWISLSNNSKLERMSYHYFRKLIRRLAEKAGLRRRVWPYLFRHTCLTALAKTLTEAKLELYAGWVHGSDMSRRYVHFSARDLEDAILEIHGLKEEARADGIMRIIECPRCGKRNPPNNARCSFCGLLLDRKLAIKIEEERMERLEEIVRRLEKLEQTVYSLLEGHRAPSKQ